MISSIISVSVRVISRSQRLSTHIIPKLLVIKSSRGVLKLTFWSGCTRMSSEEKQENETYVVDVFVRMESTGNF